MPIKIVPERIYETLGPYVRFIFILRNPVERAVSAFKHYKIRNTIEDQREILDIIPEDINHMSLDDLLDWGKNNVRKKMNKGIIPSLNDIYDRYGFPYRYFNISCYSKHIKKYLSFFPANQFFFIRFEDFIKNQTEVSKRISEFLDIDHSGFFFGVGYI